MSPSHCEKKLYFCSAKENANKLINQLKMRQKNSHSITAWMPGWLQRHLPALLLALALVPALCDVVVSAYTGGRAWASLYYHIGYETGFGGRKLLGSICRLLFPDYITARDIRLMVITANLLVAALFVWLADMAFRRSADRNAPAMLLLLYLAGPFSLTAFMQSQLSVQFIEIYQILLTLGWLVMYVKWRGRWPFYAATLVVAVACCLLHHTFCNTLFPLYVALFAYDAFSAGRLSLPKALAYGSICAVLLALLVVVWKFSTMNVDMETLRARMPERAAADTYEWSPDAFHWLYYVSNSDNRRLAMANMPLLMAQLAATLLIMSPLLALLLYPWVRAARTASQPAARWRYWLVLASVVLLTLPIFFMANDYGRWLTCWFFSLFAVLLVAWIDGDGPVSDALRRMYAFFRRHWWVAAALLAYLVQFKVNGFEGLDWVLRMRDFLFAAIG